MDFDSIFSAFWTQYRADSEVPGSDEDEYTIAMRMANEAINHWRTYDGTYWRELFTTLQEAEGGTISAGVTDYDAPDDFAEAGGSVKVLTSTGTTQLIYPIIEPQDVQFRDEGSTFAYFTGNPNDGYILHLNPAPSDNLDGLRLDYVYYRKPTEFSTGSDITEMSDPYFIVHRILANRFRASRNPFYDDALRDAENALAKMKMRNEAGNWADPWSLPDRAGTVWGA